MSKFHVTRMFGGIPLVSAAEIAAGLNLSRWDTAKLAGGFWDQNLKGCNLRVSKAPITNGREVAWLHQHAVQQLLNSLDGFEFRISRNPGQAKKLRNEGFDRPEWATTRGLFVYTRAIKAMVQAAA